MTATATATRAADRLVDALESHGSKVIHRGGRVAAQCPAHEDREPSLSVTQIEGQALVYCHAGCATADVLAALRLSAADLFDERRGVDYRYDNGRTVHRTADKKFRQSSTDAPPQLYRLARVVEAVAAGRTVFVVEGEKDAHALESVGEVATCSPMGAGKWAKVDPSPLYGAPVVVVADKDEPGRQHAQAVLDSLHGHGGTVAVVEALTGKDAADHLAAGRAVTEFVTVPMTATPAEPSSWQFAADVADEARRLQVREAARAAVAAEKFHAVAIAPPINLATFLAEPDPETTYLVDRIWPTGGRVILTAQHKAGKTTGIGNLLRALVDGDPFLGEYRVEPVRRVVLLDNELDPGMLRRWLREHAIRNTDRIDVLSLRGRVGTFDILSDAGRAEWARVIGAADVLIMDCLRPAMDALGLDENRDAGRFLVAFDALLAEARISAALIVHHMGHNGERSRGDSRLLDWPDVLWNLVRERGDDDDPADPATSRRYFKAYGRDVNEPESMLGYDPAGRRLTIAGGTRQESKADAALPAVIEFLATQTEGVSQNTIEAAVCSVGTPRNAVRSAIRKGIGSLQILTAPGPKRATLHSLNPSSAPVRHSAPPVRQRSESECASAPIDGALHSLRENPSTPEIQTAHSTSEHKSSLSLVLP